MYHAQAALPGNHPCSQPGKTDMKQAISSPHGTFRPGKIALALLVSLLPGHAALAETSVWEVMLGESLLYLGGTVHGLRLSDHPLPDEFEHAYANADEIHFEIDVDLSMPDPATDEMIAALVLYTDGRSLQTVLSEEVHADFYSVIESLGIPFGAVDSVKPGPAVALAEVSVLETFGFLEQHGVEEHFARRADRDGLPQRALETVEFQTRMLARLGEGNEDAMVADFVSRMETMEEDMDKSVKAWREGNMQSEELMLTEMAEEFPEDFELLLASRNRNWIPLIMAMLEDADIEFVLVGVAHMPGEDGVLALLREQGATVRKLALPDK